MIVYMNYTMLEYDKIDISEGIDINKTSASIECDICHYWYFLNKNLSYEPYLCYRCLDLMQKAMNFNDVAIVPIKGNDYSIHFWHKNKNGAMNSIVPIRGNDYRIHFWHKSKNDAMNSMNNSSLNEKTGSL